MLEGLIKSLAQGSAERMRQLADAVEGKLVYDEFDKRLMEMYSAMYGTSVSLNEAYRIHEARNLCNACPGILNCREGGLELHPYVEDGVLRFTYKPCDKRLERIRYEKYRKACEQAGLPDVYDNLKPTKSQQDLIDKILSSGDKDWYYVHGGLASGKTLAVVKAAQGFVKNSRAVKFWNVAELMSRLNPQNVLITLDELMLPDVLILDDFGAQYKSDWSNDRLFMVVDGRYRKRGITIFTSNYVLGEAEDDVYDELNERRIKDRIRRRATIIQLEKKT